MAVCPDAPTLPPISTSFVKGATCVICGKEYPPDFLDTHYVCPDHPHNEGILDIHYNYTNASFRFPAGTEPGYWRYRAVFPLPLDAPVPPLLTGMTPLYHAEALARELGIARILLKDDSREPTASFKDRASALAVAIAKHRKAPVIATASTGNAAAALAGMAASMDMPCVLFVPKSAPAAKLAQLQAYGARIILADGPYDLAFELCMQACASEGWYNRNTAYNPAMAEGKKTVSFEICEQLGWENAPPTAIFVGTGDGCILAGVHKGFKELKRMGIIERVPRLFGVQAAGSDWLAQAFEEKLTTPEALLAKAPINAHTIADSISAGLPRDRVKAMNAVTQTGGAFIRVSDEEILAAIPHLAQKTGVFAEPAGAASLAGLIKAKASGLIAPSETVCLLVTGSGLKDIASAQTASATHNPFPPLLADAKNLSAALQKVKNTL